MEFHGIDIKDIHLHSPFLALMKKRGRSATGNVDDAISSTPLKHFLDKDYITMCPFQDFMLG